MDSHTNLKYAVVDFFESIRCTNIVDECRITLPEGSAPSSLIVDVAARLPDGRSVAAECGSIHSMASRLVTIVDAFDEVYWAPMMPFLFKLTRKDLDVFSKYSTQYRCKVCHYSWYPRRQDPKVCPNCKSRKWREVLDGRTVANASRTD